MPKVPKVKTTVVIEEEVYQWIQEEVKKMRFYNDSHAVNVALKKLMEEERKNHVKG